MTESQNNNKKNNDDQSLVKNNKSEITTSPKETPSSINMAELARQGLEEIKKHGGEVKARQEQKINQDGTTSTSQYVGINIPNRDLKIESFQVQEIPQTEKTPSLEGLEKQFNSENPDEKLKSTTSQENLLQKEERAEVLKTVDSNLVNDNNDNNSGREDSKS